MDEREKRDVREWSQTSDTRRRRLKTMPGNR